MEDGKPMRKCNTAAIFDQTKDPIDFDTPIEDGSTYAAWDQDPPFFPYASFGSRRFWCPTVYPESTMSCPEGQHVHIKRAAFAKKKDNDIMEVGLYGTPKGEPHMHFIVEAELHEDVVWKTARHFQNRHLNEDYWSALRSVWYNYKDLTFSICMRCNNIFYSCEVKQRIEWECVNTARHKNKSSDTDAHRMHVGVIAAIAGLIGIWIA